LNKSLADAQAELAHLRERHQKTIDQFEREILELHNQRKTKDEAVNLIIRRFGKVRKVAQKRKVVIQRGSQG
jgi:hypothetical protein